MFLNMLLCEFDAAFAAGRSDPGAGRPFTTAHRPPYDNRVKDNTGFRCRVSRLRSYELRRGKQVSEKREPQNTEQGIMNVEGKENFSIRNSLFDIRYSK